MLADEIKKQKFDHVCFYGDSIAKVWDDDVFGAQDPQKKHAKLSKNGKLIFVTAMTPDKFGVGKTTVSIGLADSLNLIGENAILSLREPSMGPVFGIKGGATGGGKSVVEPSEKIDLHFTGDFHAVAQANNLLASIIDNHIYFGNTLKIDPQQIYFKRCLDINDRSLREITYKIGDVSVKSGFNITAASEVMAILALSRTKEELRRNLSNILVAKSTDGKPVFARDLEAENAMTLLLEDSLKPNAVLTKGNTLALVHAGPFANIAHGCSSVNATALALSHADYCVTEGGFGCDLGGEKFFDITASILEKVPDVAVLVVSVASILHQGNGSLELGFANVKKHMQNLRDVFKVPFVVAVNTHADDQKKVLEKLCELCENEGAEVVLCSPFEHGGAGCKQLAETVIKLAHSTNNFCPVYETSMPLQEKIEAVAKKVYGAKSVVFSQQAKDKLEFAKNCGFDDFYVNIAKTQYSFSDDKNKLGAPKDFDFHVSDVEIRSGAKMIVPIAGNMLLMPALGRKSRYLSM